VKKKVIILMVSSLLSVSALSACSSNTANNQTGSPASSTIDSSTINTSGSTTDNSTGSSGGSASTGSTAEPQNKYADGVYDGTGTGKEAGILVHVTIKDDKITDIKVIDYHDTPDYFEEAAAEIIPAIISTQSTEVETVSGCTYSSKGIIQAVCDALFKASAK